MKANSFVLVPFWVLLMAAHGQEAQEAPLYAEAVREFTEMKATIYQHKTEVDRENGVYKYDCVEFVSYAMRQAAPRAWGTIIEEMRIPRGRIPSPPSYQKFFSRIAKEPKAGWEAVVRAADLRPGDIVSWDYKTARASGHAVVIAGMPEQREVGQWVVKVFDSTSTPHGEDSRQSDDRTRVYEVTGRRSGLGHGVMAFTCDVASGELTGYRWTPSGKTILCPIGAGRPRE